MESLSGFSDISKGTFRSLAQNPKMRGLEKVYLQRLEFQGLGSIAHEPPKQKKSKVKPRAFMDRFVDDPRELARGEQTKMKIGPVKQESPRRPTGGNGSQSSLQGVSQIANNRQVRVASHSPEAS